MKAHLWAGTRKLGTTRIAPVPYHRTYIKVQNPLEQLDLTEPMLDLDAEREGKQGLVDSKWHMTRCIRIGS